MNLQEVLVSIIGFFEAILPILIPFFLALVSSLWDGSFTRMEFGYRGRFTAKLCYSAIAFDVWAISNISRTANFSNPLEITRQGLTWSILILLAFHLAFQHFCLNKTAGRLLKWMRIPMVLVSLGVPWILLGPPSMLGF